MKRKNEVFFYDPYLQETTPDYWDCNCKERYINSKETYWICMYCGADADDQPDSIIAEVVKAKEEETIYE